MIKVQTEDFDISAETRKLRNNRLDVGAIVSFTGTVRQAQKKGNVDSKLLVSMLLEHYPGMTEKELERLERQAMSRWDLQDCLIIHRYGELVPGDNIVLVMTMSRHRKEAFEAAAFLMDILKTSAPFWKKETFAGQDATQADWVKAKQQDTASSKAWINQN